jgi:predicted nucleic acid-binding protein
MRLVLDTNIFVSAVLKANSLPFRVVRWVERNGGLLKSTATEQEVLAVLARPHIAVLTVAGSSPASGTISGGCSQVPS